MAITGGMKFFEDSKAIPSKGASVVASSGSPELLLDESRITRWRSVGSSDSITETITVTLNSSVAIDRLHLGDLNWKEFTIKYDVSGSPTDFTSVVGLDGALGGGISETAFADDSAYYEFDEVTTSTIYIEVTKTQTADEDKFLNKFIATKELGTLQGFPRIRALEINKGAKQFKMISGKALVDESAGFFQASIDFRSYPGSLTADLDLMFDLYRRDLAFYTWVCGGKRGAEAFSFQMEGYRLRDIYRTKFFGSIKPVYTKNVFTAPVNFRAKLVEHVII